MSKPKVKQYTANELLHIYHKAYNSCPVFIAKQQVGMEAIARHVNAALRKAGAIRRFTKAAGTVTQHTKPEDLMNKLIQRTVRRENNVLENICKHGVGHPAFGSADYWWLRRDKAADPDATDEDNPLHIHGCCGCCHSKDWQIEDLRAGVMAGNRILLRTQQALLRAWSLLGHNRIEPLLQSLAMQSVPAAQLQRIQTPEVKNELNQKTLRRLPKTARKTVARSARVSRPVRGKSPRRHRKPSH